MHLPNIKELIYLLSWRTLTSVVMIMMHRGSRADTLKINQWDVDLVTKILD